MVYYCALYGCLSTAKDKKRSSLLGSVAVSPRASANLSVGAREIEQAEIPPHLLRQYYAQQPAPAQTQVISRPQAVAAAPARLPYQVQSEPQYQQQYQPAPQPQYRPQAAPQPQYRPQPQYQPARPQETREPEDYDPHPSYQFGFDVNDDQYTNYQNRKEQREGDTIKGSYSVVDSDGFIRTVTYTADPKEGFKAEVQYLIQAFIFTACPTEGHRHLSECYGLGDSSHAGAVQIKCSKTRCEECFISTNRNARFAQLFPPEMCCARMGKLSVLVHEKHSSQRISHIGGNAVSRQPTDIVVKIPTPKPQALQPQTHQQAQPQHSQQQAPQYYRYQQ
ncbi:hypothetical protein MSG28_007279 [Choristoneura fumiferana]|uniref:Uncharacterized protein n=1 Tax=Choristoneura fumiferana TaxID=7141 RepID=A0ACC0JX14_CHOFU|nr:hypothetical protein MSG28_007279 [Choristoneura fumiferana]